MEDRELLLEYVSKRTESAFAELVQRHIALVYSTAMRLVGDVQSAQDVCQSVFIRLARKAASIREGNALPGWLYRATYNEALSMLRNEKRRRLREVEAMKVAEHQNDTFSVWEAVGPLLDEGMSKLDRLEQNAVVLRFFQNKPLTEIGQALGVSEEAARKRISRALEKLRAHFARRGLQVSSAVLVSAIAAHAVQAAPFGLASGFAAAALAGTSKVAAGYFISNLIQTVTMTKLKYTALTALVLAAACIPIAMQDSNHKLKVENARLLDQVGQKDAEIAEIQASLEREIGSLQNRLQQTGAENLRVRQQLAALQRSSAASQTGNSAQSANPAVGSDPDYVRVKRANTLALTFDVLTPDLKLANPAIDILELTPSEITKINELVAQFKTSVQSHDLANISQISPADVTDPGMTEFLKNKEGQISVYRIPPYDKQQQQAVRDWVDKSLRDIIGQERADRFLTQSKSAFDYWLGYTQPKLIAFIDSLDPQSQQIQREWMIAFTSPSIMGSHSGKGSATIPDRLRYLFDAPYVDWGGPDTTTITR